ncbi:MULTISPECIES: helix-turn-helix domain-containing protein [Bacillus]|uniref:helix-turn-helix domain-containing protein n=1 Tax=Bacillus TaxID=1386 RepID=UPI000738D047|nr:MULTISPECIES: helix-turn-helix domain-containing protein [Bacillus]KUF21994.1 hypothetical protein AMR95_14760 [Bacillus sp. G1(2015b)]MCM3367885.1 helix-turn-helix domain-containing protein [Bacillus safensis]
MQGAITLLTVKDVQNHLKIGKNKAYTMVHDFYENGGGFKVIKIGEKGYRIPESSFVNWINNLIDSTK